MGSLFRSATTLEALTKAWLEIQRAGEVGDPRVSIQRFAEKAEDELPQMAEQLSAGTYQASVFHELRIPKRDGSPRVLHIPTVRDRIVERALLEQLTPLVDPWLSPAAHAYRPGRGVTSAVRDVVSAREEGQRWVLRTDVDDFFPSISRGLALRRLSAVVADDQVDDLVSSLLWRRVGSTGRGVHGVPQGAPLSPILSNLVLTPLDERLLDHGFRLVRYADDLTVVADSPADCHEALRLIEQELGVLNMRIGADKTQIMSFEDGFSFLGEDFGPSHPPATAHEVGSASVLYVARQGSRVRILAGQVKVESKDDEELLRIPHGHVDRIVAFGSVGVTAGVRRWASDHGKEVVFASRRGSVHGVYVPTDGRRRLLRLRAQFSAADDPERSLEFACRVVEAKLAKQIVLLQRSGRREIAESTRDSIQAMRRLARMVPEAKSVDEAMGLEGAAAREYFPALGRLVPDEMAFSLRSRRPPRDLPNACLSFGYTLLTGEAVTALLSAGLEPAVGMLHAEQENRPSLALDLMEEFRPLVVDQVTMSLLRRGSLTSTHARPDGGGVLLTKEGRRVFTRAYELRMQQVTSGAIVGFSGSLRRHLYRQAQLLARWVREPNHLWVGLSWR
ncbi:CRISPR-associated endonuclease Cas1 [Aeromicrobium duanguangcaii]|uniref:CRISPR-associated endonuclease Cas1 n=1 Tax=Aeromicrobium duanguangcaii TaxID=2968086 RepID=UPI0020179DC9|nr:CRISPR-associated endonuclease Cas1 [Aeromicrobium duanguangcaii]MCL3836876.1 CRISPR-associated endonuclease Cas1 [Aeromicrobium duanguangcaii]